VVHHIFRLQKAAYGKDEFGLHCSMGCLDMI